MRLDKYIANNTDFSRREVKYLLRERRIKINGDTLKDAATKITDTDCIELDNQPVIAIGLGYFMLNKPEGVVCANSDKDHSRVFDFIDEQHADLHVAGRLDRDTTGLVLITNDGQWSHRVTSPRYQCVKTYRVQTAERITANMVVKLEKGIHLQPENIRTRPAKVDVIAEDELLLQITEGKYHQVKRMLHAVNNAVDRLHRIRIGDILLDDDLMPGEYRALSSKEIASV